MQSWASPQARAARTQVFRTFAGEGRPPAPGELASALGASPGAMREALGELHDAGQALALEQLWRLALPWYGDRLDPDWAPRGRPEAQAILTATGLTGPFWTLP